MTTAALPGPLLFAHFAYPPNALGYCGPGDSRALIDYATAGVVDPGVHELARGFEGAWPYLQLIAAANHIADPLDRRVVEAYWLGNPLLDGVDASMLAHSLDERFHRIAARDTGHLLDSARLGATPHHNFHVFSVYPWVGMLRQGHVDAPLMVLDRCRIRWGAIESVIGDELLVASQPLRWQGSRLLLGPPRVERVTWRSAAGTLLDAPLPGDTIAMHWDWACARLEPAQLRTLQAETSRQLALANALGHPARAAL
jgi:hypothetical protein